jgi:hypothetical protein
MDYRQSRAHPRCSPIRPLLCNFGDGGVRRGHLPFHLHPDQPEPDGPAADKRADLDLQINLLSEHEVTKLIALVSSIADRMGVKTEVDPEVDELKQDVGPEAVLDEIEERKR